MDKIVRDTGVLHKGEMHEHSSAGLFHLKALLKHTDKVLHKHRAKYITLEILEGLVAAPRKLSETTLIYWL